LAEFYPRWGDALKQRFPGWRAYILTADLRLPKLIGLAASRRTPLFNGALECRLFEFVLVRGSMRRARAPATATGTGENDER
jgi:putative N6-adenine-specific DNA methylase